MSTRDQADGLTDTEQMLLQELVEWNQSDAAEWIRRLARENAALRRERDELDRKLHGDVHRYEGE